MATDEELEAKRKRFYEECFKFTRGEKSYSLENLGRDRTNIVPEVNTGEERFLRMGIRYLHVLGDYNCEIVQLEDSPHLSFQKFLDRNTDLKDLIQPVLEAIANYQDKEEERAGYECSIKRFELVTNPPQTTVLFSWIFPEELDANGKPYILTFINRYEWADLELGEFGAPTK